MAHTGVALSLSEMAAAAEQAVLTGQVRGLLSWLGDGRKITRTSHIRLDDARRLVHLLDTGDLVRPVRSSTEFPYLTRLVGWSKAARLIRASRGRLVPRDAGLADRPLDLVLALLTAYPEAGSAIFPPNGSRRSPVATHFRDLAPAFLLTLLHDPGPCPVSALSDASYRLADTRYALEQLTDAERENLRRTIEVDVILAMSALHALGVAVLDRNLSWDTDELLPDGTPDWSRATVALTELGHYAISDATALASYIRQAEGAGCERANGAAARAEGDAADVIRGRVPGQQGQRGVPRGSSRDRGAPRDQGRRRGAHHDDAHARGRHRPGGRLPRR